MDSLVFFSKPRILRRKGKVIIENGKLSFYKRFFFGMFKKKASFKLGEDVSFFGDKDDLDSSSRLFVSKEGKYDTIPNENELKSDDRDDKLFSRIKAKHRNSEKDADQELDRDLKLNTETFSIYLSNSDLMKLVAVLEEYGAKKIYSAYVGGWLRKRYVAYSNTWLYYIEKGDVDSVPIGEMAFFTVSGGLLGKKSIYCGYHRQIRGKINSPSLVKEIKDHCYKNSKYLKDSGSSYSAGLFNKETIMVSDMGISYFGRKFRKDDMVFIPYRRVYLVSKGGGLFRKKLYVFGEQNIITRHKFPKKLLSTIIKKIESAGVQVGNKRSISSSKWFVRNWFDRGPRILLLDDKMIYFPNRLKNYHESFIKYSDVQKANWYKKLFSFHGTLELFGDCTNIRDDQHTANVRILMPDLRKNKYKDIIGKLHVSPKIIRRNYK